MTDSETEKRTSTTEATEKSDETTIVGKSISDWICGCGNFFDKSFDVIWHAMIVATIALVVFHFFGWRVLVIDVAFPHDFNALQLAARNMCHEGCLTPSLERWCVEEYGRDVVTSYRKTRGEYCGIITQRVCIANERDRAALERRAIVAKRSMMYAIDEVDPKNCHVEENTYYKSCVDGFDEMTCGNLPTFFVSEETPVPIKTFARADFEQNTIEITMEV